jgi:hypothetical protein
VLSGLVGQKMLRLTSSGCVRSGDGGIWKLMLFTTLARYRLLNGSVTRELDYTWFIYYSSTRTLTVKNDGKI